MAERKLSNWIAAYCEYMSIGEAPEIFHPWVAVGVIGAAVGKKVWVNMGNHVLTPNFYIIMVAPPGVATKSTTMRGGMGLIDQISSIAVGPQSMSWQSMIESFAKAKRKCLTVDGEKSVSPLTFFSSELGTLLNPNDKGMMDVLTDLWDGQDEKWKKATIARGEERVDGPWINIISGVTPEWLASYFPRELVGGGFTSRCVFIYADKKKRLIPWPQLEKSPAERDDLKEKLVHDLEQISIVQGPVEISPEVYEYGATWYEENYNNPPPHLMSAHMRGYISRRQGHLLKTATAFMLAESDSLRMELRHFKQAETMILAAEQDCNRVFEKILTSQQGALFMEVQELIARNGGVTPRQFKELAMRHGPENVKRTLDFAASLGLSHMEIDQEGNAKYKIEED